MSSRYILVREHNVELEQTLKQCFGVQSSAAWFSESECFPLLFDRKNRNPLPPGLKDDDSTRRGLGKCVTFKKPDENWDALKYTRIFSEHMTFLIDVSILQVVQSMAASLRARPLFCQHLTMVHQLGPHDLWGLYS
jgi:hypothetical protein